MYPFRNKTRFYGEDLLASRPTPNPKDHPLLSATVYSIYSQLPSILKAVPLSASFLYLLGFFLSPGIAIAISITFSVFIIMDYDVRFIVRDGAIGLHV